jgi:hypothetical protein
MESILRNETSKALKRRWYREDETEKSRRDALSKKKGFGERQEV